MEKKIMTLKSLNKKFSVLSTAVLVAASLAGAGNAFVNAKTTSVTDQVSNGEVAIYAQSAAGSTSTSSNNATSTTGGTQTNGADDGVTNNQNPAQAGNSLGANDGSQQSSGETAVGKTGTMSNVTFSATRYAAAPTVNSDGTITPNGDPIGKPVTATTDSNGLADFTGLQTGYYIFHQVTTVNGITTVKDFVVQVNAADSGSGVVNVYPKLDMSSSANLGDTAVVTTPNTGTVNQKDDNYNGKDPNQASPITNNGTSDQTLTNGGNTGNAGNVGNTNNDSTWSNSKDNQNTTTANAGDTVNWNVNSVFDSSQTNNGDGTTGVTGTWSVTDVLPKGVTTDFTKNPVVVNVTDGNGKPVTVTLTEGTDYTVSQDGQSVTVTLTSAGQQKVAAALGNNDGAINVVIPTTVDNGTVGVLKDSATSDITNAYGADLSTTTPAVSTLNVGGVDMTKVDPSKNTLANATFTLVRADNLADAQAFVKANAGFFNNSATGGSVSSKENSTAGLVMGDTSGNASISATTPVLFTTGSDGVAKFTGLNLVDDNTDASNTTNYYLVEVAAPKGFQLPSADTAANVTAANANTTPAAGDTTVTNSKPFALPFTGGAGIASIIVIAAGAGIAAFAIKRRKKDDEEAVVEK